MPKNLEPSQAITQRQLLPVEKHLKANRGSIKRLSAYMTKRLGRPVARTRMTRWFAGEFGNPDRPEPVHSSAVVMLEWLKKETAKK